MSVCVAIIDDYIRSGHPAQFAESYLNVFPLAEGVVGGQLTGESTQTRGGPATRPATLSGAASTAPRPVTKARRFTRGASCWPDGRAYEGRQQGATASGFATRNERPET